MLFEGRQRRNVLSSYKPNVYNISVNIIQICACYAAQKFIQEFFSCFVCFQGFFFDNNAVDE